MVYPADLTTLGNTILLVTSIVFPRIGFARVCLLIHSCLAALSIALIWHFFWTAPELIPPLAPPSLALSLVAITLASKIAFKGILAWLPVREKEVLD